MIISGQSAEQLRRQTPAPLQPTPQKWDAVLIVDITSLNASSDHVTHQVCNNTVNGDIADLEID